MGSCLSLGPILDPSLLRPPPSLLSLSITYVSFFFLQPCWSPVFVRVVFEVVQTKVYRPNSLFLSYAPLLLPTLSSPPGFFFTDLSAGSPSSFPLWTTTRPLSLTFFHLGSSPSLDQSRTLFTGPLALLSNVATSLGGSSWLVPKLGFVGSNFSVVLVANVNSQATLFAQGHAFSILPEGTARTLALFFFW